MQRSRPGGDRLGQYDEQVRAAARFTVFTTIAATAFLILAALWAGGCHGADADTVTCGAPQRMVLAVGAPTILFCGGLRAFLRTYQVWRDNGTWWAWQGAGWLLLVLMVLTLTLSGPPIAGPALG